MNWDREETRLTAKTVLTWGGWVVQIKLNSHMSTFARASLASLRQQHQKHRLSKRQNIKHKCFTCLECVSRRPKKFKVRKFIKLSNFIFCRVRERTFFLCGLADIHRHTTRFPSPVVIIDSQRPKIVDRPITRLAGLVQRGLVKGVAFRHGSLWW